MLKIEQNTCLQFLFSSRNGGDMIALAIVLLLKKNMAFAPVFKLVLQSYFFIFLMHNMFELALRPSG